MQRRRLRARVCVCACVQSFRLLRVEVFELVNSNKNIEQSLNNSVFVVLITQKSRGISGVGVLCWSSRLHRIPAIVCDLRTPPKLCLSASPKPDVLEDQSLGFGWASL